MQNYDESLELKLRGNPLGYGYDEEKVAIRVTLAAEWVCEGRVEGCSCWGEGRENG